LPRRRRTRGRPGGDHSDHRPIPGPDLQDHLGHERREVVRAGFGDLVTTFERVSGADSQRLSGFMAIGMLLNVIASMGLQDLSEPWTARLVQGTKR